MDLIAATSNHIEELVRCVNEQVFNGLGNKVLFGPFTGMQIPNVTPWYDGNFSVKLLGCYERELNETVAKIIARKPQTIVNVGCAEGYYAIGFAMQIPTVTVHALDIADDLLSLCREYAELNGVGSRVKPRNVVDGDIGSGEIGSKLYFMDCEGAELELLDKLKCPELATSDIIVECHEFLRSGLTQQLMKSFSDTHDIDLIPLKLPCLSLLETPLLRETPALLSAIAVIEKRPVKTVWLACWARHNEGEK